MEKRQLVQFLLRNWFRIDFKLHIGVFSDGRIKVVETPWFHPVNSSLASIADFAKTRVRNWLSLTFKQAITEVYCNIKLPNKMKLPIVQFSW